MTTKLGSSARKHAVETDANLAILDVRITQLEQSLASPSSRSDCTESHEMLLHAANLLGEIEAHKESARAGHAMGDEEEEYERLVHKFDALAASFRERCVMRYAGWPF